MGEQLFLSPVHARGRRGEGDTLIFPVTTI